MLRCVLLGFVLLTTAGSARAVDGNVVLATKKINDAAVGGVIQNGSAAGLDVESLGDVNGDGFPDIAVGAQLDDSGGTVPSGMLPVPIVMPLSSATSVTVIGAPAMPRLSTAANTSAVSPGSTTPLALPPGASTAVAPRHEKYAPAVAAKRRNMLWWRRAISSIFGPTGQNAPSLLRPSSALNVSEPRTV